MLVIRFLASRSVDNLGECGKFVIEVMSLSVKSMASWGPATPRFSMVGILWPTLLEKEYINWARSKCSICSFHTHLGGQARAL